MNPSANTLPFFQPATTPAPHAAAIEAELVDMFHRRAPAPLIALNVLFAALLVTLWWGRLELWVTLLWFGAMTMVTLANILRHRQYDAALRGSGADAEQWRRSFIRGTVANGIAWGSGGILFYAPAAPLHSAVILLLICGIAAGVAASQASLWHAVVVFAFTALLPPALSIAFSAEPIHWVVSGLLLFYLVYILTVGRINHETLTDSIRLQFENIQLLHDLQQREQHFRSLVENAPDMVVAIASNGRLLFHSPSTTTALGYSDQQLAHRSIFDLIHPEDHGLVRDKMQGLFSAPGTSTTAETRWRHADGQWRLLQCVARPLGGGRAPALVVNARDITARRAMEDELRQAKDSAEQASRVKSQFLATISHEIRTPMHAILGMADALQDSPLNADQQGYVQTFQQAGRHLLDLINDILDFSRLEASGLQLAAVPFNLDDLLDEVGSLLEVQAEAKGLLLQVHMAASLAPWRRGDPQRLRQVIVNLVNNAIKFTDHGRVELRVEAVDDMQIRFEVSDTGIGIPPEFQEALFTPFTQLKNEHVRLYGGTGLGLSICQRLVQAMGGTITVRSVAGEGSTFTFAITLPVVTDLPATEQGNRPVEPTDLPAARLLVADDSMMNQLVIKELLRDTPCTLSFAENGLEAVSLYETEAFDMVLMDIQMPVLDGWAATRRIRQFEAAHGRRAVPIVALTASAMDEDRRASLAAGCTTFVPKPLGKHELLHLLRSYLPRKLQA